MKTLVKLLIPAGILGLLYFLFQIPVFQGIGLVILNVVFFLFGLFAFIALLVIILFLWKGDGGTRPKLEVKTEPGKNVAGIMKIVGVLALALLLFYVVKPATEDSPTSYSAKSAKKEYHHSAVARSRPPAPVKKLVAEETFVFDRMGLQVLAADLPEGKYEIVASGIHKQAAIKGNQIVTLDIPPTGIKTAEYYRDIEYLPLYGKPKNLFGAIITYTKSEGLVYAGRGRTLNLSGSEDVMVGINIPHNNENFAQNKGSFRISLYRIS